ncbi:MAG: ABC transporter permease [Acetobacter sp.]|jgi:ABC-2 type transport system permease protein|nr:ABC transporter permease [Acetobacter sp.]MCH4060119.1 ABC transporter permease [Acetobacter sp.]MCH4087059.1 ABC transporter permease [Acetobacter sp.]MCI1292879.1 ABC transporter permease [Acetobacter sp.]MCI1319465.1 ABC transporter permease [Acetobacter sp.]
MPARVKNIFQLGVKELRGLFRDPMMLVLIAYSFSFSIYIQARGMPDTLEKAAIAIIDEDGSPLSARLQQTFYPPYFMPPSIVDSRTADRGMDLGTYTFTLDIPPNFQRDLLNGRHPDIQLNIDATRMIQAFTGGGYVQTIVSQEISSFLTRHTNIIQTPVDLETRVQFNQNLSQFWFSGVISVVDSITLLSIILTGAALIREREHGTIEHLLVMPVTPFEIMLSKVWSMGLVVLLATAFALIVVVQGFLAIPIHGSIPLFLCATALELFACTSIGIFMATFAKTMPQFALLVILTIIPLQMLSGGETPRENMPVWVQELMLAAPTTHFVSLAQGILYRGAGLQIIWVQLFIIFLIGSLFFTVALGQFSKRISSMG